MIPVPIGRAVGGTTVINSGTCFRAPEHVLASWATEHGIDWATSLDPEYAEAEEMLQVTPVDVERMGRNGQLVMEGAAAIGASGGPIPRNAGRCVGCSSCPLVAASTRSARCTSPTYPARSSPGRGCAPGSRPAGSTSRTAASPACAAWWPGRPLPTAPAGGRRGRGRVRRAGPRGRRRRRRDRHPRVLAANGISGKQVGRNLHIHPAAWIGGLFGEEVRGWTG